MLDVTEQLHRYAEAVGGLVPEVQGSTGRSRRWPMEHPVAVAAAALVVVVALAVALGMDDSESPVATQGAADGTVEGTLQLVGGRAGADPFPIPGTVEAQRLGSHETSRVEATSDGKFNFDLEPGEYRLLGRSPQYSAGGEPCRAQDIVAVRAGETSTATVDCQIR